MDLLAEISEHFEVLRPQTIRVPQTGAFIKHPYGVPGGFYDQLWDWDGFFIAQHFANRPGNPQPKYFRYWVKNFAEAYRSTGYPSGCITPAKPETEHRGFSLKPFIAQAAASGSQGSNKQRFHWIDEQLYRDIRAIVLRREETNLDQDTGLFFWDHAMQSGADNNAADSNAEGLQGKFLSCDLNAFQVKEYQSLAEIADGLGQIDDAIRFRNCGQQTTQAIISTLWNPRLDSFDNRRRDTGHFVECISYSNFVPLWAGVGSEDQARLMFERYLLEPAHLMSPWGGRSLSRQDRNYNNANIITPYSNWQGPIWPIANYFYFCGLMHYGFDEAAKELAQRVAKTLLDDLNAIGSMHENYCGETGRPLAPSKIHSPTNQEGGFIGWNLLIQDMLEKAQ